MEKVLKKEESKTKKQRTNKIENAKEITTK
jgi:hypothetical protein